MRGIVTTKIAGIGHQRIPAQSLDVPATKQGPSEYQLTQRKVTRGVIRNVRGRALHDIINFQEGVPADARRAQQTRQGRRKLRILELFRGNRHCTVMRKLALGFELGKLAENRPLRNWPPDRLPGAIRSMRISDGAREFDDLPLVPD